MRKNSATHRFLSTVFIAASAAIAGTPSLATARESARSYEFFGEDASWACKPTAPVFVKNPDHNPQPMAPDMGNEEFQILLQNSQDGKIVIPVVPANYNQLNQPLKELGSDFLEMQDAVFDWTDNQSARGRKGMPAFNDTLGGGIEVANFYIPSGEKVSKRMKKLPRCRNVASEYYYFDNIGFEKRGSSWILSADFTTVNHKDMGKFMKALTHSQVSLHEGIQTMQGLNETWGYKEIDTSGFKTPFIIVVMQESDANGSRVPAYKHMLVPAEVFYSKDFFGKRLPKNDSNSREPSP